MSLFCMLGQAPHYRERNLSAAQGRKADKAAAENLQVHPVVSSWFLSNSQSEPQYYSSSGPQTQILNSHIRRTGAKIDRPLDIRTQSTLRYRTGPAQIKLRSYHG